MAKVAVLILTYNEEKNIVDCIKSAAFADEIILIDSGSTDQTQSLAESLGARVIVHPMDEAGFAGQRNFALEETQAEWVFYLDADERLTPAAGEEIRSIVDKNESAAWEIKRMNIVLGQLMRHGAHRPDWSMRLYPRTAVKWEGVVHEAARIAVPQHRMQAVMQHYTYNDWDSYFQKFNRYTTMAADTLAKRGKTAGLTKVLLHPPFAFIKAYILKQGFRDGFLGFIMSVMAGFAVFVKYLKLRQRQQNEEGMKISHV